MRDEEIKKLQNEARTEKRVTFTDDFNKRRGQSHGSGNWTSRNDDVETQRSLTYDIQLFYNGAMMSTPQLGTRWNFRPSNQNFNNLRQKEPFERRDYSNNNNNRYINYRARSPYQSDQDLSRNWRSKNSSSRSPLASRQDSSFTGFRRKP